MLRRLRWLTEEADTSLLRICINLLIPALIFGSIVGNERLRHAENLVLPPIVGFGAAERGHRPGVDGGALDGRDECGATARFALTAGLQNYVYYALPLTVLLFDSGTVGRDVRAQSRCRDGALDDWRRRLERRRPGGSWRGVFNAPIITIVGSVCLNLAQARVHALQVLLAPGGVVAATAHSLGQCAIPLALLLTGAVLADHWNEIRREPSFRLMGMAVVVRFGFVPLLYLLLAKYLPCSIELKRVLVVQGAMPSAMFPVPDDAPLRRRFARGHPDRPGHHHRLAHHDPSLLHLAGMFLRL